MALTNFVKNCGLSSRATNRCASDPPRERAANISRRHGAVPSSHDGRAQCCARSHQGTFARHRAFGSHFLSRKNTARSWQCVTFVEDVDEGRTRQCAKVRGRMLRCGTPGLQHETHGGTRLSSGAGARKLCAIQLIDFLATSTGVVDSTHITHRARPCTPHTNHDAHRTLRNTHSGTRNAQHEVPHRVKYSTPCSHSDSHVLKNSSYLTNVARHTVSDIGVRMFQASRLWSPCTCCGKHVWFSVRGSGV